MAAGSDGGGELVAPAGDAGREQCTPRPRAIDLRISEGRCRSAAPCFLSRQGHRPAQPPVDAARNRIWLAIAALAADLLAWCARLALPAQVATYEPKRLRLRILAVAGRIVRTPRRRILKIDPAWPWADVITTAHARLCALPAP